MQVKVNISNEIIDWLMANVQIDSLPNNVSSNLKLWRAGKKTPTFNQIENASKATGVPFGYFFLQTPPTENLSLVDYRTVDSAALENPSRNLVEIIHNMELVQEWAREHLISESNSAISFVGALKRQENVQMFADSVRKILRISDGWFSKSQTTEEYFRLMRSVISNSGVIVMMSGIVGNNTRRPLDINEFRAFTLIDEFAPLIFINSNDSVNGRLFSLLHEFAHICIGENSLFNDRYGTEKKIKKTEVICNAVAAEIIAPQALFIKKWETEYHGAEAECRIQALAKFFRCGITVIARKALDNKFIDNLLYEKIAKDAAEQYNARRKKHKGGDYYRTAVSRIDKRFFEMLLESVKEGKTLYSDAFRLTNTNRRTFAEIAKKQGAFLDE